MATSRCQRAAKAKTGNSVSFLFCCFDVCEALFFAAAERNAILAELDSTIQSGFFIATSKGPLCDVSGVCTACCCCLSLQEPMMGVCFVVTDLVLLRGGERKEQDEAQPFGPLSGQLITVKLIEMKST